MTEALLAGLQRQALLLSVGALVLLALRPLLLRRLGAQAGYAAWLLVPALLLTPWLPSPARQPLTLMATMGELARAAAAPLKPPADPGSAWPTLALATWLGGAALVLALQAGRQWRLARLGPRLPAGASPALVGLWRPHVALPVDFEARFSAEERALILAHEQVHLARHDNAWNLLACVLAALHWWNPLAWWAARRFQADQELACDAAVLQRRPGALAAYTQALLVAHDLTPHGAPLASRWGSTHPLIERMTMLHHRKSLTLGRAATLAALVAGAAGLAYAAQTPPTAQTGSPGQLLRSTTTQSAIAADAAAQSDLVEIKMTMTLSNGESRTPRLVTRLGLPATIEWGWDVPGRSGGWGMVLTVTRDSDGRLRTLTQYREGHPFRAVPGEHTAIGASGDAIELNRASQTGGPDLQVRRTVTLLPAGTRL